MSATIDAARHTQRRSDLQTVYRCKACDRAVSIEEFIEKHCDGCGKDAEFVATKERVS